MGRWSGISDKKEKSVLNLIYFLLLCIVVIWRLYILITYCFHQTDIDQAMMWYGTAEAGHFVFPELHFYGQNYGSMVDSYIAIPLFWLNVPFNIALPLMVSMSCIVAFLIMSLALFRKGHYFQSILILLILSLNSWRWDINTSIPRSFFSGFLFSVIGIVLINQSGKKVIAALGAFLAVISALMTMTSLAVIGIGITGILLANKDRLLKNWRPLALGAAVGIICIGVVELFYMHHSEHAVFPGLGMTFNIDTFKENIENLWWTLSNFVPFPSGRAILCLFIVVNLLLIAKKRYKPVVLNILLVMGTLFLMFMQHTGGCLAHTLYSKVRFFLYIPYCLALIVYMNPDDFNISGKYAIHVATATMIILVFCKTDFYLAELNNSDSELYHSKEVIQEDAHGCLAAAEQIVQLADDLDVHYIAFRGYPGRVVAYAAGALSYGKHEVYGVEKDRRYSIRESVINWTPREVLLITYTPDNPEGWTYSVDIVEDIRAFINSHT